MTARNDWKTVQEGLDLATQIGILSVCTCDDPFVDWKGQPCGHCRLVAAKEAFSRLLVHRVEKLETKPVRRKRITVRTPIITLTEDCARWLIATIREHGGTLKPEDAIRLASEKGFRRGTLYRARRSLEGTLINTDIKHSPQNCWLLIEKE
jgi:hypothetical protein